MFDRLCEIVDSPSASDGDTTDSLHKNLRLVAQQVIADGQYSVVFCSGLFSFSSALGGYQNQTNDKVGQFRLPLKSANRNLSSVMKKSPEFVCH